MYRWIGLALLLVAQIGCFTPVTSRIDYTNRQMEAMRKELAQTNAILAETKTQFQNIEKQMEQTNKSLKPLERLIKPFGINEVAPVGEPITPEQCWAGKIKG